MKILKFFILLIIVLVPKDLMAEDPKIENLKLFMGEWIVNCSSENEKECTLERSVFIDPDMKKKLITVIIQKKSTSKDVRFVLISPLGTLIPSGVKIGFDGKFINDKAYAFNVCQQVGCITSMLIKEETLDRFKRANNLNLEYVGPNRQKININFDLDGFTREFRKISKI